MNAALRPRIEAAARLRSRQLGQMPELLEMAIELLRSADPGLGLSETEARHIAEHMVVVNYPKGAGVLREEEGTQHMLLLLSGEVSITMGDSGRVDAVTVAVLGAGSLLGELGLLDGEPRSASCTALSPVQAAALSRDGLQRLLETHPTVAAKLLAEIGKRIAQRLRSLGAQLTMYADLVASTQLQYESLKAQVDTSS